MGADSNVAMGGTMRVAFLMAEPSCQKGEAGGPQYWVESQFMKETINTLKITNPTSYMQEQTDEQQHHQAFAALFSTAPIQQKRSTKCNSSSIANITKQQGQGTQDWEERQE